MSLISWNNDFSVNIKKIDNQHKKLVELLNKLHDGMKEGKGKEILKDILNELINYTEFHFSTEERLFKEYNYPDYKIHKKEHEDLTQKTKKIQQEFTGQTTIVIETLNFLKNWIYNHILKTDKKYASFFNNKGIF